MRQRLIQTWAAKLLMMTASIALPATLLAQDPQTQGSGGASFAGGQMVRGTVTAATADHLTVKTDAGETYQVVDFGEYPAHQKNANPLRSPTSK